MTELRVTMYELRPVPFPIVLASATYIAKFIDRFKSLETV
jgi:hypothetical protein